VSVDGGQHQFKGGRPGGWSDRRGTRTRQSRGSGVVVESEGNRRSDLGRSVGAGDPPIDGTRQDRLRL
jgi:hypothetical protein